MARTRLSPDERRTQLLALGAQLFSAMPYDDVHIERVAELAGVSRGLLYHYFPTKRAFFAELVRAGSKQMLEETAPNPEQPPIEQLRRGVDAYLVHCGDNPHTSRAVQRGAASADPEVQALIADATGRHEERILATLCDGEPAPGLLRLAVRAWIVLLRTACQEWLDRPELPRDQVRDVCVDAFVGMMLGLPHGVRPRLADELLVGTADVIHSEP